MVFTFILLFGSSCHNTVRAQHPPQGEDVRPDEMVDLVAVALTPSPLFPVPGEQIDVKLVFRNEATSPVRQVPVLLFAGDRRVESRDIAIGAGDSAVIHLDWRAPLDAVPTALTAVIDPDQRLIEQDRLDNVVSAEIVPARMPPVQADFAVFGLELVSKSRPMK